MDEKIRSAPNIEAVEVVRCRECMHCLWDELHKDKRGRCMEHHIWCEADGFCHKGAKMDGGAVMAEVIRFDKKTVKWFYENQNAETTVARCEYCCLYYKPELGHVCDKSPKLEFNRKISKIELRACPCCGGKANLDSYPGSDFTGSGTYHCVRCTRCYLRTCDHSSAKKAVEAWNRRANDDP